MELEDFTWSYLRVFAQAKALSQSSSFFAGTSLSLLLDHGLVFLISFYFSKHEDKLNGFHKTQTNFLYSTHFHTNV